MSATASDPFVQAAAWLGAGSLAVALAMLIGVVLVRLRLKAQQAREQDLARTWQPLLAQCLDRVPALLPRLAARDAGAFLRLWIRTQESLRGDASLALNELAQRLAIERTALDLLAGRNVRLQLLALAALGHLRLASTAAAVRAHVSDPRPWLSLAAAQAWLRIDEADALPSLLRMATERDDWSVARVAGMLRGASTLPMGKALAVAIALALPPVAPARLVRLLKLAAVANPALVHGSARLVFERSEDPEAIGAALALLHGPGDAEAARRHGLHTHWYVRMEAVRALGRVGTPVDLYLLVRSLGDPHWWVRYRAAQALAGSTWLPGAELDRVAAGLRDRFAVEILREARAEQAS